MATLGEEPTSNEFSSAKLKASLLRSEQRRASARARRHRQWRNCAGFVVLIALCGLLLWRVAEERYGGPPAPALVVIWPNARFPQRVASGAILLGREGQSFTVTVPHPDQWHLQWITSDTLAQGASMVWQPSRDGATLTAHCRPVASGWGRWVAWLWPERQVTLQSRLATSIGGRRFKITPPAGGLWLFPFIRAEVPVIWDEHALPFLLQVPQSAISTNSLSPLLWTIVPAFPGTALAVGDTGTYAKFLGAHPETELPTLARQIAAVEPKTSIKFLVTLSRDVRHPSEGILRLAFDAKGERGGWLKRPNGSSEPVKWWSSVPGPPPIHQ